MRAVVTEPDFIIVISFRTLVNWGAINARTASNTVYVSGNPLTVKVQLREKLARVKVFSDYLFGVQPKFLGPKIIIPN